jgi:menaquinone reductase, molybdopterin-binding-like subunit
MTEREGHDERGHDRAPSRAMSRRTALAALGGVGAVACRPGWSPPEGEATSRALAKPHVAGAEAYGTYEERWFHSSCGQCAAACGIRVRVVEGRAVRIEGDRDSPLNRGGIGARGVAALQGLYDPRRIAGPLRRDGDVLVPVSWDDALADLGERLAALRLRGEPDRLLVWTGLERGVMHDLLARLARAYGTPNFVDGRPGRSAVLAHAMAITAGAPEVPIYDWDGAAQLLSLETGLLEACQSIAFTRGRARLVHAGPVLDLTAYNADEWIRIQPGTGGALALGLVHALVADGAALPAATVDGADELRRVAAAFTPDRVAAITGATPRAIAGLAAALTRHAPTLVLVDERSLAYSNGLDTALAAMALNAVLGAFWAPAGWLRVAPPSPLAPWPDVAVDDVAAAGLARPRLDGAGALPYAASVHETLPEAIAERPPAIALLHHTNPAYARQQPRRWRRALAAIPYVVSFSPYGDETVDAVADLVLPDHTFLERWELAVPAPALDRALFGRRLPVVAPVHDTRATGDVVLDLAERLGGAIAAALPWRTVREATQVRVDGLRGRGADHPGFWIDDPAPAPTPARITVRGAWSAPAWHGDAERYPLRLLVHRAVGSTEACGDTPPWLRSLRPFPGSRSWTFAARVHPDSAPGIRDGGAISIESEWGAIEAIAHVDPRVEPGVIAVPMGAGRAGFGGNVLDLVRPGPAPETGAALLCATRVRIARARGGS